MMPDYIREKYKDGNFTTTHFSDLLRLELLYMYGGCWIDATVYCSEKIPTYMLESQFFMFKTSVVSTSVLKGSSWWICARKGENIIKETRTLLYNYWKDEIKLRNYFILHIAMARVINESSFNRATYNNAYSVCNSDPHILWGVMGKEFDEDAWLIVKSNSKIHKLSYKRRFIRGDIYNFYEALIDGALQ